MVYYVRFETMIIIPCFQRWANTWIGWQTNLAWSSTHPEQYLKIRTFEKKEMERLIIDHLKSRRKSDDWISKILKVKKCTSISIQQCSISCLCISTWSFDHLNTSSQERSWLIAQNLKVWSWSNKKDITPSHNKNLNGKTEYSIDLMP